MQQPKFSVSEKIVVEAPESSQHMLALGHIISQCFNADLDHWPAYVQRLDKSNFRVIHQHKQVVGGLGLFPMGQWFGEQSVPMTGLAAVGIAPDCRGQGAAEMLLSHTLQDLQVKGVPLAALYASTSHLYRRVGFEQAGSFCGYSAPVQQVIVDKGTKPYTDRRALPLISMELGDKALYSALYQQQAPFNNGYLDRNQAVWQTILEDNSQPVYAYLLGSRKAPEGYVIFTQQATAGGGYDLKIRDRICLTEAAIHRFWTFVADHRSLADRLFWYGPPIDPLLSVLEEQIYRIEHIERWLLRIVNVSQALALRGYPAGVETELHLDIEDPLFADNTGRFILQVDHRQGQVTRGGRGDLKLDIRGLAPLYSGFLSAGQLQQLGWASGKRDAIAIANTLFAGSAPWMSDHF
ncbi:MAG: enhanced intracellular survival protein Eis [Thermosynechococcaceae cyanobacterium]